MNAIDWNVNELDEKYEKEEIWKPLNLEIFGDYYLVSNFGKIKSAGNGHLLKARVNNGYLSVSLSRPTTRTCTVSRCVAMTFVCNKDPSVYNIVNHIDENKLNNHYKNLEWVTQKENVNKSSKITSHAREVFQLDMSENEIARFSSVEEAAKNIGIDRTTIGKVLSKVNQTAGGYKWKYVDPKYNHETANLEGSISLQKIDEDLKHYMIFRDGRIYNQQRKKFLNPVKNLKEMLYVTLPGKKNFYVSQLVARSFIENPLGLKNVYHINKNKGDNRVENLMWK